MKVWDSSEFGPMGGSGLLEAGEEGHQRVRWNQARVSPGSQEKPEER